MGLASSNGMSKVRRARKSFMMDNGLMTKCMDGGFTNGRIRGLTMANGRMEICMDWEYLSGRMEWFTKDSTSMDLNKVMDLFIILLLTKRHLLVISCRASNMATVCFDSSVEIMIMK